VQEASHAQATDSLALVQHNALVVQDAAHAHSADNLALVINLTVQGGAHGHTADSIALTQHNILAVADALHAHTADNLSLSTPDDDAPTGAFPFHLIFGPREEEDEAEAWAELSMLDVL
jgi:hypothetical protein